MSNILGINHYYEVVLLVGVLVGSSLFAVFHPVRIWKYRLGIKITLKILYLRTEWYNMAINIVNVLY